MEYRYVPIDSDMTPDKYLNMYCQSNYGTSQYMKEMYPKAFAKLQNLVEEECMKNDYRGSILYDEYPDKLGLRIMVGRIYENAKRIKDEMKWPDDEWIKDSILVLLLNEMCMRKRQKRYY